MQPRGDTCLFGSRINPLARGGDIDLLLLTDTKLPLKRVRELRRAILSQIGEQKLDIVNFAKQAEHPFKDIALQDGLTLWATRNFLPLLREDRESIRLAAASLQRSLTKCAGLTPSPRQCSNRGFI